MSIYDNEAFGNLKELYGQCDYFEKVESSFFKLLAVPLGECNEWNGGPVYVDFASMEEDRRRVNWLRAFGKFPVPLYESQHPPLPLTSWPCAHYDCGKSLTFPIKRSAR